MQKIIAFMDGKKSVLGTIVLGIIGVLASAGIISVESVYVQIVVLVVGVLTGISFRSAISKSGPPPMITMTGISGAAPVVKSDPLDSISR